MSLGEINQKAFEAFVEDRELRGAFKSGTREEINEALEEHIGELVKEFNSREDTIDEGREISLKGISEKIHKIREGKYANDGADKVWEVLNEIVHELEGSDGPTIA